MAIQSFFKPRRPRTFQHKPIYWDPRKEALDKRVERVRNELIASGELEGTPTHEHQGDEEEVYYNTSERIRGRFLSGTEHLQRQADEGIDQFERSQRILKLILMLLGLGVVVWYFFFR